MWLIISNYVGANPATEPQNRPAPWASGLIRPVRGDEMPLPLNDPAFWIAGVFALTVFIIGLYWPIVKIVRRAGFSGWWSLLFFVPLGIILGLWLLALKRWPALSDKDQKG